MYQEKGFKTIFDDVKPRKIEKAHIPEDEIIKPKSLFHINNDKFDTSSIVDEYKIPSFKFIHDDSLNDFFNFPDISLSNNPIYKFKYPKLSTGEYIKQQWQTEQGTPNELNRFMRQDQLNFSLDDIKQSDDAYQAGLDEIQKIINEDSENIKNAYNKATDVNKKQQIQKIQEKRASESKDLNELLKKNNPVIINKVLETTKNKIYTEDDARKAARNLVKDDPDIKLIKQLSKPEKKNEQKLLKKNPHLIRPFQKEPKVKPAAITNKSLPAAKPTPPPPVAKPVAEPVAQSKPTTTPTSPAAKPKSKLTLVSTTPVTKIRKGDVVNETKSSEPMKKIDEEKLTKVQSLVRQKLAKKALDDKRKSIDKSDEKTDVADTNPQTETYKVNFDSFKKLMQTYKDLSDTATIDDLPSEDRVKMKGYMKALGIPLKTKILKSLRKKLS